MLDLISNMYLHGVVRDQNNCELHMSKVSGYGLQHKQQDRNVPATNSPYTAYHYLLAEPAERRRNVKKFLRDTMTDVQSE
jgi:hypothetical protein